MYQIYYKMKRATKRAPSKISLKYEYEMAGEIEAFSRSEAVSKWYRSETTTDTKVRNPDIGDVIRDPMGRYFILTPQSIWAAVDNED